MTDIFLKRRQRIERRIVRIEHKIKELLEEHEGKETSVYNYYAGQLLGYWQGKLSILEELLEDE